MIIDTIKNITGSTDKTIVGNALDWLNTALTPMLRPHTEGKVLMDWKFWFGLVGVFFYWATFWCGSAGTKKKTQNPAYNTIFTTPCTVGGPPPPPPPPPADNDEDDTSSCTDILKTYKDAIKLLYYLSMNLLLLAVLNAPSIFSTVFVSLVMVEVVSYLLLFCFLRGSELPSVKVENVYDNITFRFSRATFLFVAQLIFLVLYLDATIVALKPLKENNFAGINYAFWLLAMIASQFGSMLLATQDSQVGAFWNYIAWAVIFSKGKTSFIADDDGHTIRLGKDQTLQLALRCCMDFIINGFCRLAIILSVPLWMMTQESGLDLVMNSLAITFITTLDDRDAATLHSFSSERIGDVGNQVDFPGVALTMPAPIPEEDSYDSDEEQDTSFFPMLQNLPPAASTISVDPCNR